MKSLQIGNIEIKVPIIQGGMGVGISLSGLAAAVANQGGIGVISTVGVGQINKKAYKNFRKSNIDALSEEIQNARRLSSGAIGVNIMVAISNYADMVETSIKEGIDFIFSGAGLPLDLPKYLTEGSNTKLVPIVSSARATNIVCSKWMSNYNYLPDAIVVEGPKAGGHLGFKPEQIEDEAFQLENLVPEILKVVRTFEEKYNKRSLFLLEEESIRVKIYTNLFKWEPVEFKWELALLQPLNVMLPTLLNRLILMLKKKISLSLTALLGYPVEPS